MRQPDFIVAQEHASTPDGHRYWVSTVQLPNFGYHVNTWETMVFDGPGDGHDHYCHRYHSAEDAQAGHRATVEALKRGELEMY